MKNIENTIKMLETFLSEREVEGICGYIVDPVPGGKIQVIIVIDLSFIDSSNTKASHIAIMTKNELQQEIKKWLNLDVYVGATADYCDESESLTESMSPHVKRRLSDSMLLDELNTILDYEFELSAFPDSIECVEEVCDTMNERILDSVKEQTGLQVSLKEKDDLYFYLVHRFGKYIAKRYRESIGLRESKKKYIVTESQYNLILESQKYIKLFQEEVDNILIDVREECKEGKEFTSDLSDYACEQLDEISKIEVTDADWVIIKHSNRNTEEKIMSIKIMVYYSSIHKGDFDADDITYSIEKNLRNKTSMPLIVNYESTNTNTFFEW